MRRASWHKMSASCEQAQIFGELPQHENKDRYDVLAYEKCDLEERILFHFIDEDMSDDTSPTPFWMLSGEAEGGKSEWSTIQ